MLTPLIPTDICSNKASGKRLTVEIGSSEVNSVLSLLNTWIQSFTFKLERSVKTGSSRLPIWKWWLWVPDAPQGWAVYISAKNCDCWMGGWSHVLNN